MFEFSESMCLNVKDENNFFFLFPCKERGINNGRLIGKLGTFNRDYKERLVYISAALTS